MPSKQSKYTAKDIQVLEGLQPVRKRPGMYIGGTGKEGLHHMIWEIFDNGMDEALGGYCDLLEVSLLPDDYVEIRDYGRGIPVDKHPKTKKSALEMTATTLHAGGKFSGKGYKVSSGLHGVGLSVVNALAENMEIQVYRDGKIHFQEYERGKPLANVKAMGDSKEQGTKVLYKPDPIIFTRGTDFEMKTILRRLEQQAYLTPKVRINVYDRRELKTQKVSFYFEGGVSSYVRRLNRTRKPLGKIIAFGDDEDNVAVEVAMQYKDDFDEEILTFANNKLTQEGGSHLVGYRNAITRVINNYARTSSILKEKDENLTGDDVREGLTAIVSVKLSTPHEVQFEGQTKGKLGNPEVKGIVYKIVTNQLAIYFEENPKDAKEIITKCLAVQRARKAAKAAKDSVLRKGLLEGLNLAGKLSDCASKDRANTEIFLVEGDSAGGSTKQARDRYTQAVLPLRGKVLNTERARIDRVVKSTLLADLIMAIGTGLGEEFNIEKLRYGKIITMFDADVDGSHIRTLTLTFFHRYMKPLIEGGYVYAAQPPLFKVATQKKKVHWAQDEADFEKIKAQIGKTKDEIKDVQRYKGLGEMNEEQLWETTMNPENRVLRQINIEDIEETSDVFERLMGNDPQARRKFIQENASDVKNLDI